MSQIGRKGIINDLQDAALLTQAEAVELDGNKALGLSDLSDLTPAADHDGAFVAEVADANVIGGIMVAHRIVLASGADANVDVLLTHKTRVVDVVVVLKGAGTAGSIVGVENVVTAITDVIDVAAGGDAAIFRPATISDATHDIAAATNLRVAYASTGADFPGAEVTVIGYRTA